MDKQKVKNRFKEIFESTTLMKILYIIGVVVLIVVIFSLGAEVGFYKASFSRAWGNNYERNFAPQHHTGIFGNTPDVLPNAHGAIGKIISVQLPTFIVVDEDGTEKVVLSESDTHIREGTSDMTSADLKVNDSVIVIGSPNSQGQIEAKFIRIMPAGLLPQ